ncbi:MAG TPA: DUF5996 family protein [Myxococcaceae bacterium]|nr:DUF5996 family protein [Myxococcaceae bacterium]
MEAWPELPLEEWKDTCATLHRYTQVIGKVRLALAPMMNHWWQVALYVTARGLSTSPMPSGSCLVQVDFDFIDHELRFLTSDGEQRVMELESRPVAEFYMDALATLRSLGIEVSISDVPCEIPDDRTPFGEDWHHATYVPEQAWRWWRALVQAHRVFERFRARFTGKCSPVHFFWGSFDLAVTRFSGRLAPERPGADAVTREAYREELLSAGFWPGTEQTGGAAFYCYAAPEPPGFATARVRPRAARYAPELGEYLLPYEEVRRAGEPDALLLDFLQSTYEAGAELGGWERERLERPLITPRISRTRHPAARAGAPEPAPTR